MTRNTEGIRGGYARGMEGCIRGERNAVTYSCVKNEDEQKSWKIALSDQALELFVPDGFFKESVSVAQAVCRRDI